MNAGQHRNPRQGPGGGQGCARSCQLLQRMLWRRLHVARKERHHDEWDRPVEAYDSYGPGVWCSMTLWVSRSP